MIAFQLCFDFRQHEQKQETFVPNNLLRCPIDDNDKTSKYELIDTEVKKTLDFVKEICNMFLNFFLHNNA